MNSLISKIAPDFTAQAAIKNDFQAIKLSQFKGKYTLLFFYPLDFTFVCPTELHAFQEQLKEFEKINTQILACSVDSKFSHNAWLNKEKSEGGIKGVEFPIIEDLGGTIAKQYKVLNEENVAYRAVFLIDDEQIIQHISINNLAVGRNVEELLRLTKAFQHTKKTGNVCPANWNENKKSMKATATDTAQYLKNN